jgi:hypothetical protein
MMGALHKMRRRVLISLAISLAVVVLSWGSAFALFSMPGAGPFFMMFFALPVALVPALRAFTLCSNWEDRSLVLIRER